MPPRHFLRRFFSPPCFQPGFSPLRFSLSLRDFLHALSRHAFAVDIFRYAAFRHYAAFDYGSMLHAATCRALMIFADFAAIAADTLQQL